MVGPLESGGASSGGGGGSDNGVYCVAVSDGDRTGSYS